VVPGGTQTLRYRIERMDSMSIFQHLESDGNEDDYDGDDERTLEERMEDIRGSVRLVDERVDEQEGKIGELVEENKKLREDMRGANCTVIKRLGGLRVFMGGERCVGGAGAGDGDDGIVRNTVELGGEYKKLKERMDWIQGRMNKVMAELMVLQSKVDKQ